MTFAEIVSSILDLPVEELHDDLRRGELAAWDSMAHIRLITALEEAYGIMFSTDEIESVKTLGQLRQMVEKQGVGK